MAHFFSRRKLSSFFISTALLFAIANALVIASVGSNSNNINNIFVSRRASGGIRNNSWNNIPRGAGTHKIKQQQKLRAQERREQLTVLSTTSDTEGLAGDEANYEYDSGYTPAIFPKEEAEKLFIMEVLKTNFMFQDPSTTKDEGNQDLSDIVKSFEKYVYDEGTLLYKQGDNTENNKYLYLIGSGSCSVSIDGKVLPVPSGTVGPGSLIGEVALLYGTARAATVRTKTPVTVYRLHKTDFGHFMHRDVCDKTDEVSSSSTPSMIDKIRREVSEIDNIIDRISGVKTKYDGDIIQQFKPSRQWLWRRWRGTILQHAWKAALANMCVSLFFMIGLRVLNDRIFKNPITWPIGGIPDVGHPMIIRMVGLFKMWGYTLSITTLVLSFYLNKAYALWRDIFIKGRKVQGQLNNLSMVLACVAERDPETGRYTDRARSFLDEVGTCCRLCHALSWAGFVNRFNVLLTPRGLSRMLSRGMMTRPQYETLVAINPNKCEPQHTTLMWIMSRVLQGMTDGIIPNDTAIRSVFMNDICSLRGTVASIGGILDGKFPMAYAQFVQVLVDTFLWLAPFALYCQLGIWSVLAVGILNVFFSGLNDLAKILLDPLDNCDQSFYKDSSVNMDVGVLIRQSNAGSTRWKIGLEELPFKYNA